MMRATDELENLAARILKRSVAPEAQIEFQSTQELSTRFGDNAITQNQNTHVEEAKLTVWFGRRHASSLTNGFNAESLDKLVARTEEIARSAPEDSECVFPLGPQNYPEPPPRYDDAIAAMEPEDLAHGIRVAAVGARKNGFTASGLFHRKITVTSLFSSRGLTAFDRSTRLSFSTTMHGPTGSGRGSCCAWNLSNFDTQKAIDSAIETARLAQNPREIQPGQYTVILEPRAVCDLLPFVIWDMDARDAAEGRTVFTDQLGRQLLHGDITIETELNDPRMPGAPYGESGLPMQSTVWIRHGVVQRLMHDRYWAEQQGEMPDAGFLPILMSGSNRSTDDLVKDCEYGILVKRLWYIRYVDRKELLLTGMTRDGLFLIKDGKIEAPVKNLRFNESPITLLKNVIALGKPVYVDGWSRLPSIMSSNFTFSSITESV